MRSKRLLIFLLAVVTCFCYTGCAEQKVVERSDFLMDTFLTQKGMGNRCEEAFSETAERLRQLENQLSRYETESEISNINRHAGKSWVTVSQETYKILKQAVELCQKSDGIFDITMGAVIDLWGIQSEDPSIPNELQRQEALEHTGYQHLLFDDQNQKVTLDMEGVSLDLGGIAKGAASDIAAQIYREHQVDSALFSTSSSVYTCGEKADSQFYTLGIRDPRGTVNDWIGVLKIKDQFVGSSGDYERYFEQNGKRYHHIIDPRTGAPADNGLMGVTVIADDGVTADFMSTYLFVMGEEYVKEHLQDYSVIAVAVDGTVYVSDDLMEQFLFDTSSGYHLR